VVVFSEDHRCSPRKSIARPVLFVHAKFLSQNSISDIFEIFHWEIIWSSAEKRDFMTEFQFSTKISFVSSFFETIFFLIDNQLKP
jgi:hypothetical protein